MYRPLNTLEDIKGNIFLIFKHSLTCPISAGAKKEVDKFVAQHDEIPVYMLIVQEHPELKQSIAQKYMIKHESPQIIAVKDGGVVGCASHYDVKNIQDYFS